MTVETDGAQRVTATLVTHSAETTNTILHGLSRPPKNRIWYWLAIGIAALFVANVRDPIQHATFQDDLVWYIPTIWQGIQGKSWLEVLKFLTDATPREYGVVSLNLYTAALLGVFGLDARAFLTAGVVLHALGAGLTYRLGRAMRIGRPASVGAGLLWLVYMPAFGAYLWPMAAQHQLVVLASLLVLERYLSTERAIEDGRPARWRWVSTIGLAALASLLRPSVLLLPLAIGAHVLFGMRNDRIRLARLRRWAPALAVFLGYPLGVLAMGGEPVLRRLLPAQLSSLSSWTLFGALVACGAIAGATIWACAMGWRHVDSGMRARSAWIGSTLLVAPFVAALLATGHQPLDLLIPLQAELRAVFDPLSMAQTSDNASRWNYLAVGAPLDIHAFGLALGFSVAMAAAALRANRALVTLIAWYLGVQVYLTSVGVATADLQTSVGSPVAYPARYFVYLAPCVAIGLAALSEIAYRRLRLVVRSHKLDWLALALVTGLLLLHPLALRLVLFRHHLANNVLMYEDLRAASLARDWVAQSGDLPMPSPDRLSFRGVLPPPYSELWQQVVSPFDPQHHELFESVLTGVFAGGEYARVPINPTDHASPSALQFTLIDGQVLDPSNQDTDFFARALADGAAALQQGDAETADLRLAAAAQHRPFLVRMALSDQPDQDLRYLTNGIAFRPWLRQLLDNHLAGASFGASGQPDRRMQQVSAHMQSELDTYVRCITYLAYLSRDDPDRLASWAAHIRVIEASQADLIQHVASMPELPDPVLQAAVRSFVESERLGVLAFPVQHITQPNLVAALPSDWPWQILLPWPWPFQAANATSLRAGEFTLRDGFYLADVARKPVPRWTSGRGVVEVLPAASGELLVRALLIQPDFGQPRPAPDLQVQVNRRPMPAAEVDVTHTPPDHFDILMHAGTVEGGQLTRLTLASPTFIARDHEVGNADARQLGIQLEEIQVLVAGESLKYRDLPVLPGLSSALADGPTYSPTAQEIRSEP